MPYLPRRGNTASQDKDKIHGWKKKGLPKNGVCSLNCDGYGAGRKDNLSLRLASLKRQYSTFWKEDGCLERAGSPIKSDYTVLTLMKRPLRAGERSLFLLHAW